MDHGDFGGLISVAFNGTGVALQSDSRLSSDKYSVAVIKAREVVSLNESYKADRSPELKERLSIKLNRLLGFLMSQFKAAATTEAVREVLKNSGMDVLNADELSKLPDAIVPVTIVRALMKKHRIMVDPRSLSNWADFQERYESQVLHA